MSSRVSGSKAATSLFINVITPDYASCRDMAGDMHLVPARAGIFAVLACNIRMATNGTQLSIQGFLSQFRNLIP
jgi:hypothetical protein